MTPIPRLACAAALAALASASPLAPLVAQEPELSRAERAQGLATFWKEVDYNFAYFDQVPELDWDAAFREHIEPAMAAGDLVAYYRVLQRMCALLRDGHTNIYPPAQVWQAFGKPPIALRAVQGRAIVDNVAASLVNDLPIGSEILTVDGQTVATCLAQEVFPFVSTSAEHIRWDSGIRGNSRQGIGLLYGATGSNAQLSVRWPDGSHHELSAARVHHEAPIDWLLQRPRKPRFEFELREDGIAVVALNSFGNQAIIKEFEDRLPELRQAKGLVIDLRANGGGNTSNGTGILRHLIDRPVAGSKWQTREHNAAFKAWGTLAEEGSWRAFRYQAYKRGDAWHKSEGSSVTPAKGDNVLVPTAVLIGHHTASAAEDFLVCAETIEHFTTFGEATYGSTGQPLFLDLPGGGRARICTKRDTFPDGRDFVGTGIQPDVTAPITVEDLRAERDPAMAAALAHLGERIR